MSLGSRSSSQVTLSVKSVPAGSREARRFVTSTNPSTPVFAIDESSVS